MRGVWCSPSLLRIHAKNRGLLQMIAVLLLGTIYCLVLGSIALSSQRQKTSQARDEEQSKLQPDSRTQQPAVEVTQRDDGSLDLSALEEELEVRRQRVWEVCESRGLHNVGQPNAWEFFIDNNHGLVWCNIFKAASSVWMYNFNLLGGYKEQYLKQPHSNLLVLARSQFPRPSVETLRASLPDSLSFLIVREPFERLLSAFRNKVEGFHSRFYRRLGREIVTRFRRRGPPLLSAGPTFPEFVDYVVETSPRFDEHWAPYHSFCTPCHVNFTVVAKVETLARDQEYVIRKAGLESLLLHPRRGARPKLAVNKARDGRDTRDLIDKYYGQLSTTQLGKLYAIYGVDFDMFGYNASKYFNLAHGPAS